MELNVWTNSITYSHTHWTFSLHFNSNFNFLFRQINFDLEIAFSFRIKIQSIPRDQKRDEEKTIKKNEEIETRNEY